MNRFNNVSYNRNKNAANISLSNKSVLDSLIQGLFTIFTISSP